MKLSLNKLSALRVLRAIRRSADARQLSVLDDAFTRTEVFAPDPYPLKRWAKSAIDLSRFGLETRINSENPLYVAVNESDSRIRMKHAFNTVYAQKNALPEGPFVNVGDGLAISSPELLYAEMASLMDLPRLALLGYELCGSYARNPDDPRDGNVVFGVAPVTSVQRIKEFLGSVKWVKNVDLAKRTLGFVSENAWSPMEALVALLANLPESELGYGMGRCALNERVGISYGRRRIRGATARVPDILFPNTHVGLNYDGQDHLDLQAIVDASVRFSRDAQDASSRYELNSVVRAVREKAIDDLRRNRELAASGYIVLPVTKEDLYCEGGFDQVMAEVAEAVEVFDRIDMRPLQRTLASGDLSFRRQQLIWSLLPRMSAC